MMTTTGKIMRRKVTRMTTATRGTTVTRVSHLWDLKRMMINCYAHSNPCGEARFSRSHYMVAAQKSTFWIVLFGSQWTVDSS